MTDKNDPSRQRAEDWWQTSIIEMSPGVIRYHGYAIEDLIGEISFPAMIWLMLRGDLPSKPQANLLGTALMSAVDHGPQAPSIAIARMAATCGVGINNAMASAANVLGDVHGGAGEQCMLVFASIAQRMESGLALSDAIKTELDTRQAEGQKYLPGYGHRFHPVDPRSPKLLAVLRDHQDKGLVAGDYAGIAQGLEDAMAERKGRRIPLNIDGATAAIYAALGFPPALCRGLFVLSRSVGIMAHAWEQMQEPARNKGPIPREWLWSYVGHPSRPVPLQEDDA